MNIPGLRFTPEALSRLDDKEGVFMHALGQFRNAVDAVAKSSRHFSSDQIAPFDRAWEKACLNLENLGVALTSGGLNSTVVTREQFFSGDY